MPGTLAVKATVFFANTANAPISAGELRPTDVWARRSVRISCSPSYNAKSFRDTLRQKRARGACSVANSIVRSGHRQVRKAIAVGLSRQLDAGPSRPD